MHNPIKVIHKADGTTIPFVTQGAKPTLQELQDAVGGYIEMIYLDTTTLVVNEEGKLRELPINLAATKLLQQYRSIDILVGDVVQIDGDLLNGDDDYDDLGVDN